MGGRIRRPAVSGQFYPGDKEVLARTVDGLLAAARTGEPRSARAGIAPHAGYEYSGPTAAHLFAAVALPALVVVLAPNHTGRSQSPGGASLWAEGAFRTPLGDVPVARGFAAALSGCTPLVADDASAHVAEHAVEVELPFLLRVRPDVEIVPLVLAWDDWPRCRELADALTDLVTRWPEPVFLLASSDLHHYEPAAVAEAKDAAALDAVRALDGERLLATCRSRGIAMCGRAPTAVVCEAARRLGSAEGEVLDYRHSGWVTGDHGTVVGYAAVRIA